MDLPALNPGRSRAEPMMFEVYRQDGSIVLELVLELGLDDSGAWAPAMSWRRRHAEADRLKAAAHRRIMAVECLLATVLWLTFFATVLIADAGLMGDAAIVALAGHLPINPARPDWRAQLDSVPKVQGALCTS